MRYLLILSVCCTLLIVSSSEVANNDTYAQLSENSLESIVNQIVNQTNVITSTQIRVGDNPTYISADPADPADPDAIYVANSGSDTVSVIDPDTNTVIKHIPVGDNPISLAGSGSAIYVANYDSDTVSAIDTATNTMVKNIAVGENPISLDSFGSAIYVANEYPDTVDVIDPDTNTVIKNYSVGEDPSFLRADPYGWVYVANEDPEQTVSVINTDTDTVTDEFTGTMGSSSIYVSPYGEGIYIANSDSSSHSSSVSVLNPDTKTFRKFIHVGKNPSSIDGGYYGDPIYVANSGSDTVSAVNSTTNTVIENIHVGDKPSFIYDARSVVYVANSDSDTVSVIDPDTNTVIKNITVGNKPSFIYGVGSAIYVANSGSGTVSVIDPYMLEVVAGVTFDIYPFTGGQIVCNDLNTPINRHFYVSSGTECIAKPNNGFEFSSWTQNFAKNSSITVNASTASGSPWTPLLNIFGIKTVDPAANLTVNRFGNFTANFKALPPPVPAEYTASLFTVVITALVGSLLIPATVGWFKSKKQTSRLNSFHQQMARVYADGKVDENDVDRLNALNKNISDSYSAGKISNDQYTHLKNEVSVTYQKIFKKRIDSITNSNTETLDKIKNDIRDAYSDGKLTELHYNVLNEQLLDILKKRS